MKKWKKAVIKCCPNIPILRKLMREIKSYRMATGIAMTKKEIKLCENNPQEKDRLLKKYTHRYVSRTKEVYSDFDAYIKRAGIVMENAEKDKTFSDIMFCHFAYGFRVDEYYMYNLQSKTPEQRKEYMSDRDMHALIIYKINDVIDKDYLRNKAKMYERFKEYYKRDAVVIRSKKDFNLAIDFIKKHSVFIEKSARENCGRGVRLIDITKQNISAEQYIKTLLDSKEEYLLEEKIIQSDIMAQLNPSSVNTVRLITFYDGKNVSFFMPFFRVGRRGSFIDNGAAGGILCFVDEETGICYSTKDEFLREFVKHPDSGFTLSGFCVPNWDECKQMAVKLAKSIPTVRFVGWDLAHTDKGWCFVEGNAHAQAHFYQMECGGAREKMIQLSKK